MASSDEAPARSESDLVMPEGLEAGLLGGLAVVATYLVPDWLSGDWLRTPTLLGRYVLYGAGQQEAAVAETGLAALFTVLHFGAWTAAGFAGSLLVGAVDRRPDLRWLPLVVLGVWVGAMVALDLWIAALALPELHLWVGSVLGGAVLGAYLVWRHPAFARSPPERDR